MMSSQHNDPPSKQVEEVFTFWHELGRDVVRNSIKTIEEAAKQIIAVAAILEGLYFHAIAFSDLRGKELTICSLIIYIAPIILLLVSLIAALYIFFPKQYDINIYSAELIHKAYEKILNSKIFFLRIAAISLILGILALFFTVLIYLRG